MKTQKLKVQSKTNEEEDRKKRIQERLLKIRIISCLDHGNHIGVENGISTKQIAKDLKCERQQVMDEIYLIKLYFRKIGKNLQRIKPPKGDSLYFFASDKEEEILGLETHEKRIVSTLKSLGKEIQIAYHNFPKLKYLHKPIQIEDGVTLEIRAPKK